MPAWKLTLAYDGTDYVGWQVQPNGPSVQQALIDAVLKVAGEATLPEASGRTDSGVHALGQVVALRLAREWPAEKLRRALNAVLPDAMVVRSLEPAAADFDPNRQAKRKLYRYVIHDGPDRNPFLLRHAWHVRGRLADGAMAAAAARLLGTHDFRCFESRWPNRASSVRHVTRCAVVRLGDWLSIDVEANGFLYNMVRSIAGTLAAAGRGRLTAEDVAGIVARGDRAAAGPTAPPQGLFLVRVDYGAAPTPMEG